MVIAALKNPFKKLPGPAGHTEQKRSVVVPCRLRNTVEQPHAGAILAAALFRN
jgi:hypothetical protein